jgi:hypothetical protein
MTKDQQEICIALGNVRYLPASFDKRFGNNLSSIAKTTPGKELTDGQIEWMYRLLYKYRKQLPRLYGRHKDHHFCSAKQPRINF